MIGGVKLYHHGVHADWDSAPAEMLVILSEISSGARKAKKR